MSHRHEHDPDSELLKKILRVEEEELHVLKEIEHHLHPQRLSTVAAVQFSGEFIMATNALVFNVGQSSTISPITYLVDGVTPSGATYSAATYTFSDSSATVTPNPDGITAVALGVAPSAGPVTGSVSFTATDTDAAVSQWTVPFIITTNAVAPPPPPTQLSQSAGVLFSAPTP